MSISGSSWQVEGAHLVRQRKAERLRAVITWWPAFVKPLCLWCQRQSCPSTSDTTVLWSAAPHGIGPFFRSCDSDTKPCSCLSILFHAYWQTKLKVLVIIFKALKQQWGTCSPLHTAGLQLPSSLTTGSCWRGLMGDWESKNKWKVTGSLTLLYRLSILLILLLFWSCELPCGEESTWLCKLGLRLKAEWDGCINSRNPWMPTPTVPLSLMGLSAR